MLQMRINNIERRLIDYFLIAEEGVEENPFQREAANIPQEEEKQQKDNLTTLGNEVRTETNPFKGRDTNTQEALNNNMPTLAGEFPQQQEVEEEGQQEVEEEAQQEVEEEAQHDVEVEHGPPNFWDEVEELREGFKTLGSSIQDWYIPYLCYKKETF